MKNVVVVGAGGNARVVAEIIELNGDNVVGFLDDDTNKKGMIVFNEKKIIGTTFDCEALKDYYFIVAVGNNDFRKKFTCEHPDFKYYTAIHPNTIISKYSKIGAGCMIMPGVVINYGVEIGDGCIINTLSSIDHDSKIEDFVHLSPGSHLCGNVVIGECTWICAGAIVINNICISSNTIVGAGAVVIKNLNEGGNTYVGVPAKVKCKNGKNNGY